MPFMSVVESAIVDAGTTSKEALKAHNGRSSAAKKVSPSLVRIGSSVSTKVSLLLPSEGTYGGAAESDAIGLPVTCC